MDKLAGLVWPRVVALFFICLLTALSSVVAAAQDNLPVAFRTWPDQTVSIETYWGFTVAIGPGAAAVPGIDEPDQTFGGAGLLIDFAQAEAQQEETTWDWDEEKSVGRVSVGVGNGKPFVLALDRKPNEPKPELIVVDSDTELSSQAMTIKVWRPTGDDPVVHAPVVHVQANGIDVVYGIGDALVVAVEEGSLTTKGDEGLLDVAVLLLHDDDTVDAGQIEAFNRYIRAKAIYLANDTRVIGQLMTRREVGNTTALVVEEGADEDQELKTVLLEHADEPWSMPQDMAALYDAMDAEGRKWSKVFEPLSVRQMNHKPVNGTHTPRWNIEHMASREMFFITAAYHAADPRFPHIRLDPQQMPPDYVARHPDWDGMEEARRVYRTSAFLRRFAYLYHGRSLEQRISADSRIRFAPIMRQVTRHWAEHSNNVLDKMKLDDWPEE